MTGTIHPITMPKWGIEMQEGTVTAWHFAPGQSVTKGEALLDVETEKIVNSVEAPVSGVLRRIIGAPGEVCAVGELIGVFATADVPEAEVDRFIGSFVAADASFEPRPDGLPIQVITIFHVDSKKSGRFRPINIRIEDHYH